MLRVFMHPAINEELTVCGVLFGTCRRTAFVCFGPPQSLPGSVYPMIPRIRAF